jgi:hypothetical protein
MDEQNLNELAKKATLNFNPMSPLHKKSKNRRVTELIDINPVDEYRRAFGVYQLCQCMMSKPEPGHAYHIITGGNVDLLAHLQWVMLHWPKIKHVFLSCWAISSPDILLLARMLDEKKIGTLELLLGEIFPTKFKMEWKKLMEMYDAGVITNIFQSTIHSKVMLIHCDDDTKIVIESSANCNMNPRVEQSCVTLNDDLYDFYYSYLHAIIDNEEARYVARETTKKVMNDGNKADITDDEGLTLFG